MNIQIKQIKDEDHPFCLSDSFNARRVITQSVFYKGDGFVLAIGELNRPNRWDDEKFDAICAAIETACNKQSELAKGEKR